MIKAYKINVIGKVQGVGFRFYTNKKATELGVNGYVKNMRDGSVLIEAESDEVKMDEFISWVHQGPEWARVDEVKMQEQPVAKYTGFTVR